MIDSATTRNVLSLAGQGLEVREIAAGLELEEGVVDLILLRHASAGERDISDEQLGLLRGRAFDLAMQDEDKSVAARMTAYLIDRDKPRQEGKTSQILTINNEIKLAMAQVEKLEREFEVPIKPATPQETNGKPS